MIMLFTKPEIILKFSRKSIFFNLADKISKVIPLQDKLEKADIKFNEREYFSIILFNSFFWFIILFSLLTFIFSIAKSFNFLLIFFLSFFISGFSFLMNILYPQLLISRKVRDVEKNLPYVLRQMLIEIRGGISLFESLKSVASKDYGVLSKELEKTIRKISAGYSETEALEELALKIPSQKLRKVIWQIVNAIRSGTELSEILKSIVNEITNEQRIAIKEYASSLNPIALSFLMVGIIFPTMGTILIIILSSFLGISLPNEIFYLILFIIALVQFNFVGIVKSKRPWI
ncbi:MAG: type II secretion system F family protein [Candidatus Aenigmatarchaeota archaeon]